MQPGEEAGGALIIRFFGSFAVELGGEPLRRLRSPKGLRVLAYLALDSGKSVDKNHLAKVIWPESETPGDNLDRTLRDLRRAIGDPPRRPVRLCSVGHERLLLRLQSADKIDLLAFERLRRHEDAESLQQAVDLYQGPLLEGWGSRGGEGWIGDRQEQYHAQYAQLLQRLRSLAMLEKRYEAALGYLRRLVRAGERDETGWGDLMRIYLEKRDFENALQVYERLTEEGSSPSPEMQALRMQIPAHTPNTLRDKLLIGVPKVFTSLIGREEEMREIQKRMEAGPARLLVLTGGGGVGKTRLAIALAHRRSGDFAQGVRFIDLVSATDPDAILMRFCTTLKVTGKQELLRALQSKEVLLILDNCEQALEACSDLTHELLTSCPRLHVIATSRHAFDIGEIAWEVPCLTLPTPATPSTLDALLPFSAVRLFQERAQAVRNTFQITASNAPYVAEICRRLDGTPLAIELAAVQIRTLVPQEIAARLNDRFALLNTGPRNAQQRHRTLHATIDCSYALLDADERRLFRRLSVLRGGWSEQAAIGICAEEEGSAAATRHLLAELVGKSLVMRSGGTESRFHMLETILEYAAEKLAGNGEEERLSRRKHRDYFLQLVITINASPSGEQERMLNTLDTEFENLDQALRFSLVYAEGVQEGLRLAAALQEFWWTRGYLSLGRARLKTLLDRPEAQEHTQARAAALDGAAVIARMQGDYAAARLLHTESLEIFQELHIDWAAAYALGNLGIAAWLNQENSYAISLMQESLALHRSLNNQEGVAYCLGNLGNMAAEMQDYQSARLWMEECLQMLREQKNDSGIASCLTNLGNMAYHREDYASAFALHQEGLTIKSKLQDKLGIAISLESMASLAFHAQRPERAVLLLGAEERLRQELEAPREPDPQAASSRLFAEAILGLSDERLAKARAEGHAMALEEAIAYALRNADKP